MNYLINYSDQRYFRSQMLNTKTGYNIAGFDFVYCYNRAQIDSAFYNKNHKILDCPRGAGYWLWKPYFLYKTIMNEEILEGDTIFYSDAGAYFEKDLSPYFHKTRERNIVLFDMPYFTNNQWVKRDAFVLMDCDNKEYSEGSHWNGAFMIFKKCKESVDFISEYLKWCQDERIISDNPNECGKDNYFEFEDHRHDQSVLSLMAIKHKIQPELDLSQWGMKEDSYIHHSRDPR